MTRSDELFARAQQSIPGGVNSPVRAFRQVGGIPIFFARGEGAYIFDVDGKRYIDYVQSWGPLILGHAHPAIINAVKTTADSGLSFGAPTELEILLAEQVKQLVPSMELLRMVSSGTEATMSAIRLARGFTGRDRIVKFEGCYHGHADSLLVKAGSGALTLGVPNSAGVPADLARHTITLDYNDAQQVREYFAREGRHVAAIIVEPVAGNMNCIPPAADFLATLRALCDQHGSILIFDEVMTGFRVALGGAQAHFQIQPDLTCLGKVIGAGLPVGAFGGRRDIMEKIAPLGPVYQAGTLSGNPLAMAAGLAMLKEISQPDFYTTLTRHTQRLTAGLRSGAAKAGIPLTTNMAGSMFGFFFSEESTVSTFAQASASDIARFSTFFHLMLDAGIYLAPSAFEAGFMSGAHSSADIDATLAAANDCFAKL